MEQRLYWSLKLSDHVDMNRIQTDTLRPQRNLCSKSTDQLSRWHSIANNLSPGSSSVNISASRDRADVAHATVRFFPWAKWMNWGRMMIGCDAIQTGPRTWLLISTHSSDSVGFLWTHKKSACVQMKKAQKKITPRNCSSTTRLHQQNNYAFLKEGSFPVCSIRIRLKR